MSELTIRKPHGGEHGGYGWIPDVPDQRDLLFAPDPAAMLKLATTPHFDLTAASQMPKVWNQGQLGSCQGHASGACFAFAHKKSGHATFVPSRLWIYYQARVLEGNPSEDAGSSIRDGFKIMSKLGVPPETDWPYKIETFANAPTAKMVADAVKHKSVVYKKVTQTLTSIKAAILSGYPVAFGFAVYDSFETLEVANTGVVPMPGYDETLLGGHAVCLVGYDDLSQMFIVRNSWGFGWGRGGYCLMPYPYVISQDLAADFWQVSIAT